MHYFYVNFGMATQKKRMKRWLIKKYIKKERWKEEKMIKKKNMRKKKIVNQMQNESGKEWLIEERVAFERKQKIREIKMNCCWCVCECSNEWMKILLWIFAPLEVFFWNVF